MNRFCALVGPLVLLAAAPTAEASPDRVAVQAKLRAQVKSGRVRLDVEGLPFGAFTLAEARETPSGQFAGTVGFGGQRASALVHFVPKALGSTDGTWLLAVRPPASRLSSFIPGVSGTVVDQFDLTTPTLVFASERVSAKRELLGPEVQRFYASFARVSLELQKGVNLLTTATARDRTVVKSALDVLGFQRPQLNLTGIVLREFDVAALKTARDEGELEGALKRGTELRAALPAVRLRGLPKAFVTSSTYLSITGEPGVGIGFGLTIQQSEGPRTFDCSVEVREDAEAVQEVTVVAGTEGLWTNALGIKGFDLSEARLLLSVDQAQQVGFGLRARMAIGGNSLLLAGKVKFHAVTGVVTGGMFEGSLDSLTSRDLVAFANHVGASKGHRGKQLSAKSVPEFGFKDVYVRYAPKGDHRLGIEQGMALKGKLLAFNRTLLDVDALVNEATLVPTIQIKGEAADVDLGALSLQNGKLHVNIALTTNPFFRVKGRSKLLLSEKAIDVDISRKRFYFELEDKVAGVYRAHWKASSPSAGKPTWNVSVSLQNDFSKTLETSVSGKALAWAGKVERDFAKAQGKVRNARLKVSGLRRQIEAAKTKVRDRRARNLANLKAAEAKVRTLDGKIAARKREVDRRQAPLRALAAKTKRNRDKAKRAYDAARAERRRAKWRKKPAKRVKEASKLTALGAANAAYKTASGKLAKALTRLDAKLGSLKTARHTAVVALTATRVVYQKTLAAGPVELDPVVASLITGRGTAIGALHVAEGTVKVTGKTLAGAGKVTAWAAKHHGKLVVLDSASFKAQLASYLEGNKTSLTLRVRFLGKRHTLRIAANADDIRRGRVFSAAWKALRKTVEKG